MIRTSLLWSDDWDIYRIYWSPQFFTSFLIMSKGHSKVENRVVFTGKARIASLCAENGEVDLCIDRCCNQILQLPSASSILVLVVDVPLIMLIRVFPRQSFLLFIHLPLIALRILLVVVVLRVTLHPFDWDAFACLHINAVDPHADDVALLSEGVGCNCSCQDGERRGSFHQIYFLIISQSLKLDSPSTNKLI